MAWRVLFSVAKEIFKATEKETEQKHIKKGSQKLGLY